jgi:hypothetical protein
MALDQRIAGVLGRVGVDADRGGSECATDRAPGTAAPCAQRIDIVKLQHGMAQGSLVRAAS